MLRLRRVAVDGLFGYASHVIDFRPDEPTILTGLNGVGKTHVLALMESTLKLDVRSISRTPFQKVLVEFSDESGLLVERTMRVDALPLLRFQAQRAGKPIGSPLEASDSEMPEDQLPSHLVELSGGRWHDTRTERTYSREFIERQYGLDLGAAKERFADHPEILNVTRGAPPIFIDTKRLDTPVTGNSESQAESRRLGPTYGGGSGMRFPARTAAARIEQYIGQIRIQVVEARRASVSETQSADLSFAVRALAAAHDTIYESALRKRYNGIVDQYEDLTRNGLAAGEAPLPFPDDTTPTVRRILNVFLDDWSRRLRPLLPLNEKLTVLRRILDEKFLATGKSTYMTDQGRLGFRDQSRQAVRVRNLSSGEQHLVALYTMLVFGAARGSLVLIDEPEISMHAAWKHAFLKDITEVAVLSNLQIVLATHSTAIINGRWDLTEELVVSPGPGSNDQTEELEIDSLHEGEDWLG